MRGLIPPRQWPACRELADLDGCLTGTDVLVLAPGPSAELLGAVPPNARAWTTIACNDGARFAKDLSYRDRPVDAVVCCDERKRFDVDRWGWIRSGARLAFAQWPRDFSEPGRTWLELEDLEVIRLELQEPDARPDLKGNGRIPRGGPNTSSVVVAAAIAARLGARKVGILGCDLTDPRHPSAPFLQEIDQALGELAAEAREQLGCRIGNLSRSSALVSLEPMELDELAAC